MAMIDELLARLMGEQAEAKAAAPTGIPPMLARNPEPTPQKLDFSSLLMPKMPVAEAKPSEPAQKKAAAPAKKEATPPAKKPALKVVPTAKSEPVKAPEAPAPAPTVDKAKQAIDEANVRRDQSLQALDKEMAALSAEFQPRMSRIDLEKLQNDAMERIKQYQSAENPNYIAEAIIALAPSLFGMLAGGSAGAQAAMAGTQAGQKAIGDMAAARKERTKQLIDAEIKRLDQAVNLERADIGAYTDMARIEAQKQLGKLAALRERANRGDDVSKELEKLGIGQDFKKSEREATQEFQADQKERDRQAAIEKERIKAAAKKSKGGGAPKPTEGQKVLDREFAKDLNEWQTSGQSTYQKNIDRLNAAKAELRKNPNLTGRFVGRLPDIAKSNAAIKARDDVRAAAQGALRATLGAQFTEKEGERIMNMAYNEALSPEENIAKIDAAIAEIERNAQSMRDRAAYFDKAGTLAGYGSGSSGRGRTVVRKQYSASQNKTRITYSDGSVEIKDGRQ